MDIKGKLRGCSKSCTIRVNAILMALPEVLSLAYQQWPTLKDYLPDNVYSVGFVVLVVANILLRFKTKVPLEEK